MSQLRRGSAATAYSVSPSEIIELVESPSKEVETLELNPKDQ